MAKKTSRRGRNQRRGRGRGRTQRRGRSQRGGWEPTRLAGAGDPWVN
jgi:hypothetical protein